MTIKKTGVVLAGAGIIADENMSAMHDVSSLEVIAVVEPQPQRLKEFTGKYKNGIKAFVSWEDFLTALHKDKLAVQLAIIITPPFAHKDLGLSAVNNGLAVLMEKPLALNTAEADELCRASILSKKPLATFDSRFAQTAFSLKMNQLIQTDTLGEIFRIEITGLEKLLRHGIEAQPQSRWRLDRSKSGGGILIDWGGYDLAFLESFLGKLDIEIIHSSFNSGLAAVPADLNTAYDVEEDAYVISHISSERFKNITFIHHRATVHHLGEKHEVKIFGKKASVSGCYYPWKSSMLIHYGDAAGSKIETAELLEKNGISLTPLRNMAEHLVNSTELISDVHTSRKYLNYICSAHDRSITNRKL